MFIYDVYITYGFQFSHESAITRQLRFHCIIGNLCMKPWLCICEAATRPLMRAAWRVVGACVRAAAQHGDGPLAVCTAVDAAHMLPALELDPATQTKAIFPPKWPPHTSYFVVMCWCHPHKRTAASVCLSPNNNEGTSTSALKCLLLGLFVNV